MRRIKCYQHIRKALLTLSQCSLEEDLMSQYLQCCYPFIGACHLEIHISIIIFNSLPAQTKPSWSHFILLYQKYKGNTFETSKFFFSFILLFRINSVPFCPWKLRAFVDKFLIHSWSCALRSCRFSFPATLPSAHFPPNIFYLSVNYSSFSPMRKEKENWKEKAYECFNN